MNTTTRPTGQTDAVEQIISGGYGHHSGASLANLRRILYAGKLGGTGHTLTLPVDQGVEHGQDRLFGPNPDASDPVYVGQLALEAGFSAIAVPIGSCQVLAPRFAGSIPLVAKINGRWGHSAPGPYRQALMGSVEEAFDLGCSAVGFTNYPGSSENDGMTEQFVEAKERARELGMLIFEWTYMRGESMDKLSKWDEPTEEEKADGKKKGKQALDATTALDITADGVRLSSELGADFIKVKFPSAQIANTDDGVKARYAKYGLTTPEQLAGHIRHAAFNGRRLVLFSGGDLKGDDKQSRDKGALAFYQMAEGIRKGGCCGSICGRNVTQRKREEALAFVAGLVDVYRGANPEEAMQHLQAIQGAA